MLAKTLIAALATAACVSGHSDQLALARRQSAKANHVTRQLEPVTGALSGLTNMGGHDSSSYQGNKGKVSRRQVEELESGDVTLNQVVIVVSSANEELAKAFTTKPKMTDEDIDNDVKPHLEDVKKAVAALIEQAEASAPKEDKPSTPYQPQQQQPEMDPKGNADLLGGLLGKRSLFKRDIEESIEELFTVITELLLTLDTAAEEDEAVQPVAEETKKEMSSSMLDLLGLLTAILGPLTKHLLANLQKLLADVELTLGDTLDTVLALVQDLLGPLASL